MLDSMVATTFANVAMDLIRDGIGGRMVAIRDGKYDHVSLAETGKPPRRVQLDAYDTDRFRPKYADRLGDPLLLTPSLGPAAAADGRPALALQPGQRADRPREVRHVLVAVAPRDEPGLELRAPGRSTGSVGARVARAISSAIAEVLEVERGPEPERVLVVDHPAAPVLEDPAAAPRRRRAPPATASGSRPAFIARTMPSATPR